MSARPARLDGRARRVRAALATVVSLVVIMSVATLAASPSASAAPAPPASAVTGTGTGAASAPTPAKPKPAAPVAHPSPASQIVALEARVLRVAASLAGRPYSYGGVGPSSFDCSGYTRFVLHAALGISLPHNSSAQYSAVRHVARSAIQPGDLIFFTSGGSIYHVAIYAGHGEIWHAPHTGDHVRLAAIYSSSWVAGRVL